MRQNAQAWSTGASRAHCCLSSRLLGKVDTGQMGKEAKGDSGASSPTQHKDFLVKQPSEQNPWRNCWLGDRVSL